MLWTRDYFWRYKTWELLTSVERISSQRSCFCFHLNLTQFACFRDKQKTLESKYLNSGSDQRSWSYNIVRGGRVGCNKHCFHWKLYQARLGERFSKLHNCFVTMIYQQSVLFPLNVKSRVASLILKLKGFVLDYWPEDDEVLEKQRGQWKDWKNSVTALDLDH